MIRASFGKTAVGRLFIGAGALALLVPAIAGCEAGANAPTLEYHPASAGAQTVFNGIRITNVFVLGAPSGSTVPSGSSAGLFLSLYNGSANADELMSASAAGTATSVTLSGATVALPVGSAVNLSGPQPLVVLNSLTEPLTGGSSVQVTLDFQHAGSVRLEVPVEPQSYFYSTYSAPAAAPATAAPATTPATATPAATATGAPTTSATPAA